MRGNIAMCPGARARRALSSMLGMSVLGISDSLQE
jgi:hypothetical protein